MSLLLPRVLFLDNDDGSDISLLSPPPIRMRHLIFRPSALEAALRMPDRARPVGSPIAVVTGSVPPPKEGSFHEEAPAVEERQSTVEVAPSWLVRKEGNSQDL